MHFWDCLKSQSTLSLLRQADSFAHYSTGRSSWIFLFKIGNGKRWLRLSKNKALNQRMWDMKQSKLLQQWRELATDQMCETINLWGCSCSKWMKFCHPCNSKCNYNFAFSRLTEHHDHSSMSTEKMDTSWQMSLWETPLGTWFLLFISVKSTWQHITMNICKDLALKA